MFQPIIFYGLTVHYQLSALKLDRAAARRVVKQGRALALRRQQAGEVRRVSAVGEDVPGHPLARQWVMYAVPGAENTVSGIEVQPVEGFLFEVNVGADCEWLPLGLCRFPETVLHRGASVPTKLGGGWRFAGFSKTQYASLHGWEHFLCCHRTVVESLAEWRTLGVRVKITDEGEYWPRRSVGNLRRNVENMNGWSPLSRAQSKTVTTARAWAWNRPSSHTRISSAWKRKAKRGQEKPFARPAGKFPGCCESHETENDALIEIRRLPATVRAANASVAQMDRAAVS